MVKGTCGKMVCRGVGFWWRDVVEREKEGEGEGEAGLGMTKIKQRLLPGMKLS